MLPEEEIQEEQGLIEEQYKIAGIASLFSEVTGIELRFIPIDVLHEEIKPCHFCHNSAVEAKDCTCTLVASVKEQIYNKNGLYLCPQGMFRICIPFFVKKRISGVVISVPLSCHPEKDAEQASNTAQDSKKHLSECPSIAPSRLSKATRLLSFALGSKIFAQEEETENIKQKLLEALKENNILSARSFLERIFLKIIEANGTAFETVKNKCLELLLILEEVTVDGAYSVNSEDSYTIFSDWCKADSIGKLKQCVNAASQRFITAAFYPLSQKHAALIHEALLYIKAHYRTKITEEHVASLVYISASYFSKIFKENLGCSFKEYVNHIRIEKAKTLLLRPELSINQIAEMVGYENRSYFGKIFKMQTGTSPAKYRQRSK